ncbi:hypothetical protein BDB01DRAFT_831293 [Pilobolus umbonatus]|nr:hypothetical protein BDB01DRAFT_831293 [Pilobolus umbonatus]
MERYESHSHQGVQSTINRQCYHDEVDEILIFDIYYCLKYEDGGLEHRSTPTILSEIGALSSNRSLIKMSILKDINLPMPFHRVIGLTRVFLFWIPCTMKVSRDSSYKSKRSLTDTESESYLNTVGYTRTMTLSELNFISFWEEGYDHH